MDEILGGEELAALVERVFRPKPDDRGVAILVDLPDAQVPDRPEWRARREMAADWAGRLVEFRVRLGMDVRLYLYRNAHAQNADFPPHAWRYEEGRLPASADDLDPATAVPWEDVFAANRILLAPTEFSATAPLKLAAKKHPIRAATMPGFSPSMIPALRLDYGEINRRVGTLQRLLDRAAGADFVFRVDRRAEHRLHLDLRHRTAHASGGLFPDPGAAGNLPSGEAYIVPYEGEKPDDPTTSAGTMHVQFGDEIVVYSIERNRAVRATGSGEAAKTEADRLLREPAYGNIAELGLGVLAGFGVRPVGELLLDEKLGLHIAFGRSDHFGGQVGPAQFSRPEEVVHVDRVYLPETQPRVSVPSVDLRFEDGSTLALMRDDRYAIDFAKEE